MTGSVGPRQSGHNGRQDCAIELVRGTLQRLVTRAGRSLFTEHMGTFKDLGVWQDAVRLAVAIYELTESYPSSERYGLCSQTRRAAVSISSNIAEGKGRSTRRELCRFLDIALGSLFEVQSQLEVAIALKFADRSKTVAITELLEKTGRGITNLKRSHQR